MTITAQHQQVGGVRTFLRLDALASGALGVVLSATGGLLTDLLGLPTALLVPAGVFLILYAGWLWYLASRPTISAAAAWTVIGGNLLWIAASVTFAAAGWFSPTVLGTAVILLQAAAVAGFVAGQYAGLRRAGSAVA